MPRYFAKLSYNGTKHHGWQKQPNSTTVQEVISEQFSLIFKEEIELVGMGRTDTGVHARNFVAHFDTAQVDLERDNKFLYKINNFLPDDIAVHSFQEVDINRHARFDAKQRTYHYFINRKKNVFNNDFAWYCHGNLNIGAMKEACNYLFDIKDFTSFSKLHTDTKTNLCEIMEARWFALGNTLVFRITADRFLRNMVRSIVGTMINIGKEKYPANYIMEIAKQANRGSAGISVPAKGLFFTNVVY